MALLRHVGLSSSLRSHETPGLSAALGISEAGFNAGPRRVGTPRLNAGAALEPCPRMRLRSLETRATPGCRLHGIDRQDSRHANAGRQVDQRDLQADQPVTQHDQEVAEGYGGGYTQLTDFDWSEEGLVVGGIYFRLQVSHMKLCASRLFLVGGVPEPRPRDAVRRAHAQLRRTRRRTPTQPSGASGRSSSSTPGSPTGVGRCGPRSDIQNTASVHADRGNTAEDAGCCIASNQRNIVA